MPLLHVDLSISGSVRKSTCIVFCTKTLHRPMRAAIKSRLDRIQRYSIIGDHVDINSFCPNLIVIYFSAKLSEVSF